MNRKLIFGVVFILTFNMLHGQNRIAGSVLNKENDLPVEYVNIGIAGKNIGTVSDKNGHFNLLVESQYQNDSLLFSCIGFETYSVKISDIKENEIIRLQEKPFLLNEVVVMPRIFKERALGITAKSGIGVTGFENNNLGYECGLLMKNKKRAEIKSVKVNISSCTYDTIFYRLNIYEVNENDNFENILIEPIYVIASKADVLNGSLQIDLTKQNIIVNGNFLVTLEHIRDLGNGGLWFPASLKQKTYYRKTSQGKWETAPIGISLSVIANVEK
jgi:hypothetical protein